MWLAAMSFPSFSQRRAEQQPHPFRLCNHKQVHCCCIISVVVGSSIIGATSRRYLRQYNGTNMPAMELSFPPGNFMVEGDNNNVF